VRVVNAKQMREIEERAIREFGIPSLLLMENAALAVVQEVRQILSTKNSSLTGRKVTVFVGKGNNGGDGLAAARHLGMLGVDMTVFSFAKEEEFKGDAALNFRLYKNTGWKLFVIEGEKQRRVARLALSQAEVIIDAIYGTGFRGALPSLVEEYVEEINQAQALVVSVDIPSGVEADTGKVYRSAVIAHSTVTFGLPKLGHFLGNGPQYSGRVIVDSISIPNHFFEQEELTTFVLTDELIQSLLPTRSFQGHKGTHGRGVLVAGSKGMTGAAILAGKAALRSGIGLLQMIVPKGLSEGIDLALSEAIVWPADGETYLNEKAWPVIIKYAENAQALAIGPGLGQNPELLMVLEEILRNLTLPVVFDADALNLLAKEPGILGWRQGRGSLILTPHPGEMARLCSCSVEEIQENRLNIAVTKAVEWGAILILKGAITIIATPDGRAFINPTGNPGLGTGGTGDVLTGSILAWLAQGVDSDSAACLGVYLHGKAADELAQEYGWAGFTASDVANQLPKARRNLELNR
jgi:ADP-dependent NAD(P)H-hydrate dehydratase / NAD(P)H-hydrate epimerase